MPETGSRGANNEHTTPFVEIARSYWADLAPSTTLPLTPTEIVALRGLGDMLSLSEVSEVYLPLSRLLNLYAAGAQQLHRSTSGFLRPSREHAVRDRRRRLGRGRQVDDRPAAARAARPLGGHAAGRAGHDRRFLCRTPSSSGAG